MREDTCGFKHPTASRYSSGEGNASAKVPEGCVLFHCCAALLKRPCLFISLTVCSARVRVRVRVRVHKRACVHACVRACVRACVESPKQHAGMLGGAVKQIACDLAEMGASSICAASMGPS
jgi:hypothetical protein